MSMRSQVYEWDSTGMTVGATTAGSRISIFVGGVGNNITKPAETTATEFVVIEDIATTPSLGAWAGVTADTVVRGLLVDGATGVAGLAGPRAYVQVRINTTDYFLDPDNIPNDGIPGAASPYPRSINFQPAFNLYPDVYVLPGQVWDALVTYYNIGGFAASPSVAGELMCFVKYTLYDGPDALIANKLLEMGISINPGNVDWYKRSLLQAQA
tara:strand:+ start:6168 stop:6803 length:636 start_codon:yes stop_codon:yes gene_type:complete